MIIGSDGDRREIGASFSPALSSSWKETKLPTASFSFKHLQYKYLVAVETRPPL
jgi:hypothetical protein